MKQVTHIMLALFVFVLVSKGWRGVDTQPIIDETLQAMPTIKGIYFYDRPYLEADSYYSIADTITFYDKRLFFSDYVKLIEYEACHRNSFRQSRVLNHKVCPHPTTK